MKAGWLYRPAPLWLVFVSLAVCYLLVGWMLMQVDWRLLYAYVFTLIAYAIDSELRAHVQGKRIAEGVAIGLTTAMRAEAFKPTDQMVAK